MKSHVKIAHKCRLQINSWKSTRYIPISTCHLGYYWCVLVGTVVIKGGEGPKMS